MTAKKSPSALVRPSTAGSDAMASLVDAVGPAAAIKLVQHHGGTRLYIPLSIHPEHDVAKLIGDDMAGKLAREYGGCRLDVPSPNGPAFKALRDTEIRRMVADKVSGKKIAKEMQLTYMRVRQIAGAGA